MQPSVRVEGLVKRYGAREALRGVSFRVEAGEVVALLGPNGAGKTTTVEILEGYRAQDAGDAEVLGLDPGRGGRALRERIGIVLQGTSAHPHLSAREALSMFAGYYRRPRDPDELLELVGLGGGRRSARAHAVGRAAQAARPGARPGRLARAAVPRRADDGVRSRGSEGRVGDDPPARRGGHHGAPDDALPRRGRDARRSRDRAARRDGSSPRGRRARSARSRARSSASVCPTASRCPSFRASR